MMEYLLVVVALFLIIVVIMTGDSNEKGFTAMSRALLRALAVALLGTSFAMAFGLWRSLAPIMALLKFNTNSLMLPSSDWVL